MGAHNVTRAFHVYGARVGDRAMRALVYMALVARDADSEPWFGLGHEALSEQALGRKVPPPEQGKARRAALRSVERVITELRNAGAIRTIKRATFGARGTTHVHYRLYLDRPYQGQKLSTATRRFVSGGPESTRRKVSSHPTKSVHPPDEKRRTKEEEEEEERTTEDHPQSTRKVEGTRPGTARDNGSDDKFSQAGTTSRDASPDMSEDEETRRRHLHDALTAWELQHSSTTQER